MGNGGILTVKSDRQGYASILVSAARTAIGRFGGSLKDQKLGELAAHVARAAIERTGVDASQVGNVVLGNGVHFEPRDA